LIDIDNIYYVVIQIQIVSFTYYW